ncbi:MAG: dicarboxylate/amino acid:cation symporter, partial [Lachnospiraceae bacterium]|nr:dicarboxylate/amino acid:cation symporter [Lachnospiraceae bacterium]
MMTKKRKKLGLTTVILLALLLGSITGIAIHYTVASNSFVKTYITEGLFYVVGQGFIRLMQMLVVPLVFCSISTGAAAIGDTKTLGKVGLKTLIFYMMTTMMAVAVAIGTGLLIGPGHGLDMSKIEVAKSTLPTEQTSVVDTILNIIPTNPINALAEGNMLAIIFFALFVGLILAQLGEKVQSVTNFLTQFNDIMMEMTMIVMKAAPFGVFALIARTFTTLGFDAMVPMVKYMLCVVLALALQCFGVYQILLKLLAGLSPVKF